MGMGVKHGKTLKQPAIKMLKLAMVDDCLTHITGFTASVLSQKSCKAVWMADEAFLHGAPMMEAPQQQTLIHREVCWCNI